MGLTAKRLGNLLARWQARGKDLPSFVRRNLKALEHIDPRKPAEEYSYVIVDLETTGLDLEKDRVVSVGAVRMREGRVVLGEVFHELVNPGRSISPEAIKVHGITPDMIARARRPSVVLEDFLGFLGTDILVAHYAAFDMHFVNRLMRARYGFPLQNLVLDTVLMCQGILLPSDPYGVRQGRAACRLEALAARFEIDLPERHSALGDALITALVFQRILAKLRRLGRANLGELIRVAML